MNTALRYVNERTVRSDGLAFNDGASFGPGGEGFMRVNLACPRANVEECLRRLRTHCQ